MSIGTVAHRTGISPDTLRAWERRYGWPKATRLPSGHRRYTATDVRRVRRVAEALSLGIRPSVVIPLDDDALDRLLRDGPGSREPLPGVSRLLRPVASGDGTALRRLLLGDARRLGPRAFVTDRLAPLLHHVGRMWADGALAIRHEHLASEAAEDVLRGLRRRAPARRGPTVLLATLPGERHGLGLQMAALLVSAAGATPVVLGVETPPGEILDTALESDAAVVGISVSLASGGVRTDRALADLRERLPSRVRLVAGGAGARGARRGPRGVLYAGSAADLDAVLAERADARA